MLRKCYIRHFNNYPASEPTECAKRGCYLMGIEVVPFECPEEIDSIEDFSPEVGISSYIGDVHRALRKLNVPEPKSNIDYPDSLKDYFGRKIFIKTMQEIREHPDQHWFIKPKDDHKLFPGKIWDGSKTTRLLLGHVGNDVKVWCSPIINILSEYRVFVCDNEILDCHRYKGDWSVAPNQIYVKNMIELLKPTAHRAYCLDVGINLNGSTILIEVNDGYAFGAYGLRPELYMKMISTRWEEFCQFLN